MTDLFAHLESDLDAEVTKEQLKNQIGPHPHDHGRGRLMTAPEALKFMTGGKATVTLVSEKTGVRFSYTMRESEDKLCIFVGVLTGPDNESNYSYLGRIARRVSGDIFYHGRKVPRPGDISEEAPSAKAFKWSWERLVQGELPPGLQIWHEGRCGRCGRKLTVPESIASGFGPECIGKI